MTLEDQILALVPTHLARGTEEHLRDLALRAARIALNHAAALAEEHAATQVNPHDRASQRASIELKVAAETIREALDVHADAKPA